VTAVSRPFWHARGTDGLSAWESDRSGPLTGLTWAPDAPLASMFRDLELLG
jgi:hypothetical protein